MNSEHVPQFVSIAWPHIRSLHCRTVWRTRRVPKVTVHKGRTGGHGVTHYGSKRRRAKVEVWSDDDGDVSTKVLVHELLHARGLPHGRRLGKAFRGSVDKDELSDWVISRFGLGSLCLGVQELA